MAWEVRASGGGDPSAQRPSERRTFEQWQQTMETDKEARGAMVGIGLAGLRGMWAPRAATPSTHATPVPFPALSTDSARNAAVRPN